jgi:hypothetical protein
MFIKKQKDACVETFMLPYFRSAVAIPLSFIWCYIIHVPATKMEARGDSADIAPDDIRILATKMVPKNDGEHLLRMSRR